MALVEFDFNRKGPKLEAYGNVSVFKGIPHNFYEISFPVWEDNEKRLGELLVKVLLGRMSLVEFGRSLPPGVSASFSALIGGRLVGVLEAQNGVNRIPSPEEFELFKHVLSDLIKAHAPFVRDPEKFSVFVLDFSLGYGLLGELMRDDALEEIMVNGFEKNVFIYHKRHGFCVCNAMFRKADHELLNLVNRIAFTAGRQFGPDEALLDARMPDGSRANATFNTVSPFGHSLTIRKFNKDFVSIVEMVQGKMLSAELGAFLWLMVEGLQVEPMNIIIAGGSGSGKTTLLNALASFVRYTERIVSIEDTLELQLGLHGNWVQLEARPAIGGNGKGVSMDDLLKNSLRMRPDRIVVGEVRGPEAQTLFIAMDTGHKGCAGTLHANTAREMMIRLTSEPMNVPEPLLPLLDIVVVLSRFYSHDQGVIRRVQQVAEVTRMADKVLLSNLFERDSAKDELRKTDTPSHVIQVLSDRTGKSKKELAKELLVRQRILEWMLDQKIFAPLECEKIVQEYYVNPTALLEQISRDLGFNLG
ncbi:MAG: CpaF family protein [Candidatus Diapherotrites archaeon]|nr:CpaF family protein [Candidatus Diapherotrites archaeon]